MKRIIVLGKILFSVILVLGMIFFYVVEMLFGSAVAWGYGITVTHTTEIQSVLTPKIYQLVGFDMSTILYGSLFLWIPLAILLNLWIFSWLKKPGKKVYRFGMIFFGTFLFAVLITTSLKGLQANALVKEKLPLMQNLVNAAETLGYDKYTIVDESSSSFESGGHLTISASRYNNEASQNFDAGYSKKFWRYDDIDIINLPQQELALYMRTENDGLFNLLFLNYYSDKHIFLKFRDYVKQAHAEFFTQGYTKEQLHDVFVEYFKEYIHQSEPIFRHTSWKEANGIKTEQQTISAYVTGKIVVEGKQSYEKMISLRKIGDILDTIYRADLLPKNCAVHETSEEAGQTTTVINLNGNQRVFSGYECNIGISQIKAKIIEIIESM